MRSFALAILISITIKASGQDPLKVDPSHYKVEFENARVRLVRVHFGPHYKSVMNETPPRVVVLLTDEHVKVTHPDGTSEQRTLKAGEAFWSDGGKGMAENLDDKPFELIWVIPKETVQERQ
jgi:hypothetical protein